MSVEAADSVLQEVAAHINQHHYRESRSTRATAGRTTKPATPPPAPMVEQPRSGFATSGSVHDYMPGTRPASSARSTRRPPRPRMLNIQPAGNSPASGGEAAGSASCSQGSTLEAKTLPLEDSAERVSSQAAIVAAPPNHRVTAAGGAFKLPRTTIPPPPAMEHADAPSTTRRPFFPAACQLMSNVRASASTEKMGHIMRMIEELEKQANEEARQVAPAAIPTAAAPDAQGQNQPQEPQSAVAAPHPMARVLASQPFSLASKQVLAAAATNPTAARAVEAAEASKTARKSAQVLTMPAKARTVASAAPQAHAADDGTAAVAMAPPSEPNLQPAAPPSGQQLNAAAVASSVRAKIQHLQQQVAEKDSQVAALRQQVEAVKRQQAAAVRAAEVAHKDQLAAQKAEAEAQASRSMNLIERIMKDKDALSTKCAKLSADVGAMQAVAAKQIETLKEGLAQELRKQKEVWVAAERAKREAWMAEQTRSIKESTVKGLEPEIQRLVEAHKAEMKRVEQRQEVEIGRRLQAAAAQHEEQLAAVRAQAASEQAAALEAERAAVRDQVKDAQSRFEVELQSLRMRLAAEHQMQLDRADAARREDQARMQQQAVEHEQRVAALKAEWECEKQQLALQRQREVEGVRQQYEVIQEAWRAAASERARRELEGREAALRRQLAVERDEELAAVVSRLEEDALAKEGEMQKQLAAGEAAAEAKWRAEVSHLQEAESKLAEKCDTAESRAGAAERKIVRLEELVHTLQREVSSKGSSLAWLEDQLAAARKEAANRQEAVAAALLGAREQHARELAALQERAAEAEGVASQAQAELEAVRERRLKEMGEVEARFWALLNTKDGTIASMTQQLQELHAAVS